ncbi:hypothetical protein B0T14DRAFT_34941 [Immersiella caudata]|uniref:Uncharacterized protein n=1 Tax=Immersiella caudata TaxID=314043 RepID=A0AA39XEJ6_9PEZI|nr:hypothetical protein B0T14DRAFT_34941 [Immersiella caudata]
MITFTTARRSFFAAVTCLAVYSWILWHRCYPFDYLRTFIVGGWAFIWVLEARMWKKDRVSPLSPGLKALFTCFARSSLMRNDVHQDVARRDERSRRHLAPQHLRALWDLLEACAQAQPRLQLNALRPGFERAVRDLEEARRDLILEGEPLRRIARLLERATGILEGSLSLEETNQPQVPVEVRNPNFYRISSLPPFPFLVCPRVLVHRSHLKATGLLGKHPTCSTGEWKIVGGVVES